MTVLIDRREIRHLHLFCGLGGGAKGFNRGSARVGNMEAHFRCIGGIDIDAAAVRDFDRMSGAKGTLLDLFDREQYQAFHGVTPPPEWTEATTEDIRRAAGNENPHIVFMSPPCKGFSGLLSERKSASEKYQALNRLTVRGVFLMLEAFSEDLPELVLLENVPRIQTRGRHLLDQITRLLQVYGYTVTETTHDCGELGGLAQSRKRFLMVARLAAKVPSFLYEPVKRPLRAVGEVLERLPLPGDPRGGPMHLLPNLQWKTWVRLAFVEAGSDWRSLNRLRVEGGKLADYVLTPDWFGDVLGVLPWSSPSGTITGGAAPTRGAFSVADPRYDGQDFGAYGVNPWQGSIGTITSQRSPGQGPFSVADPRTGDNRHYNVYRVTSWSEARGTVTGGAGPSSGSGAVADPRPPAGSVFSKYAVTPWQHHAGTVIGGDDQGAYAVADPRAAAGFGGKGKYRVTSFEEPSNTIIAQSTTGHGGFAVADPRVALSREKGDDYLTAGHYGIVPWDRPCGAVAACAAHDNGRFSVADPRLPQIPKPDQKLVVMIRSLDGTWHRPFTTLELASLQSLVDPEELADFSGNADGAKRERIGNAVPPDAAKAIADVMAETLLLSWSGQLFQLSSIPIWVRDVAVALAVHQPVYSH
jgi:site-specific DNA-cytosine methylase